MDFILIEKNHSMKAILLTHDGDVVVCYPSLFLAKRPSSILITDYSLRIPVFRVFSQSKTSFFMSKVFPYSIHPFGYEMNWLLLLLIPKNHFCTCIYTSVYIVFQVYDNHINDISNQQSQESVKPSNIGPFAQSISSGT